MLKSKSNRKQRRNPNTLNTERLEQRAMFSVSPVEPVVALDVGPVNQADDNGCSIVHPEFRTGSQAGPRGTSFMSGDDVRMIVHPEFRGGGDGIRIVHPEFRGGGDGIRIVHPEFRGGDDSIRIVHPEFDGDATSVGETLVGRESERPQPLDLPSREMLDAQLNDGLHNMHQIDTTLMDQAITEAMMQDVYMDMVLGSMVYQEAGEVGIPAEQPNQSINIGSALFSRKEQRHNSTSDVQDGTAPPVDLDGDGDCEDYEGVDHCPNEEEANESETDDCFPPIILEEIYGNLGREEIHSNYVGHENLASVVRVQEMVPRQNHLTQTLVNNYSYANNYARNQAFHNWH